LNHLLQADNLVPFFDIATSCPHYPKSNHPNSTMKATLLSAGLLAWLVSMVSATALTYKLNAHEKACFYAAAEKENIKIAFYFAVRHQP
jgi:hypothetical protein